MLWSYGLTLMAARAPVPFGGENPGASLPWALSSLVLVCVALWEEVSMRRLRGAEYESYAARVPFLVPLPSLVSNALRAPMRRVLKKDWPENGRDIGLVFLVYTALLVVLSLPFVLWNYPPGPNGWFYWPFA
jgi:protein-S-isoprenylcysteine O-methyltransferase Ste14